MELKLKSKITNNLTKNQILQICKLKDSHWDYGLKSQFKWFENKLKKNDIHNLLYLKKNLIGYTLLRVRTCIIKNTIKKKYLLFDTMIIDKKNRNKNYSKLLMNFNNKIIKKYNYFSFLICDKYMVNFYKKHNWKNILKKNIIFLDHSFSKKAMTLNNKLINNTKFKLFVNK